MLPRRIATITSLPATRRKPLKSSARPRILVIEDDPYAREALTLLLDYYGYDVVAASNGTDGLALVTEATPDLVVTDWRMPGFSGLALCVALRERRDTMPIIVVTSADEVFAHEQPVNARLRKPIDPPLAQRVINDELRAQSAASAPIRARTVTARPPTARSRVARRLLLRRTGRYPPRASDSDSVGCRASSG